MKLDRKEFLRMALATAGLGFGATRVAGCGGDSPGTTGAAGTGGGTKACVDGVPTETISANHGHTLAVSQADVASGVAKTYSIKGTSPHDHMVTVSGATFLRLRAGESVTLTSTTTTAHSHMITIVCV